MYTVYCILRPVFTASVCLSSAPPMSAGHRTWKLMWATTSMLLRCPHQARQSGMSTAPPVDKLSRPHYQQLLPCLMLLVSKACCEHCTSRVCAFSWDAADTGLLGAEDHCDGRLLARDVEPRYEALQCTTGQVWAGAFNMLGPPVLNV